MSVNVLVRGARQLVTLRGPAAPRRGAALQELSIIRDGALLIRDGRIVEVNTSRRVENLAGAREAQEIDVTGHIVIPGFVDCHAHVVGAPLQQAEGAAPPAGKDAARMRRGLAVAPPTLRNASAKRLESRARLIVHAMARHGTTTLEAESGYGLDQRGELKVLRAQGRLQRAPLDLVSTFLTPLEIPAAYAGDAAGYLAWICGELLPVIQRRSMARYAGLRCRAGVFDAAQGRQYLVAARALGFDLKIHACGTDAAGAAGLAVALGAVSVDGLNEASAEAVAWLAGSETLAVMLPGDGFSEGRQAGNARRLIDGGAAVALGSNFCPGTASSYSMQAAVAVACAQWGMSAAEAICAATFNAAYALGVGGMVGSLEAGKQADLIVLNAADYREIPDRFGSNLVRRTMKRGVMIYREGKVGGA